MNDLKTRLIVVVFMFAAGVAATSLWTYFQTEPTLCIVSPDAAWERIFFGRGKYKNGINQATEMGRVRELRQTILPEGDLEVRVWRFADDLEGVILRRASGEWSASYLKADTGSESFEKVELKPLPEPKSGWASFWRDMTNEKLLDLPDSDEIGCRVPRMDGISFVVEINQDRVYRTYSYQSSTDACDEAKRMDQIGEIIGLEFDSGQEQCSRTE